MFRGIAALLLCTHIAAADDTVMVDGNAYVAFFGGMAGGSVGYEHRFTPESGLTLRGLGDHGAFWDGGGFDLFTALVGYRQHWDRMSFEIGLGWMGLRHERTPGNIDDPGTSVRWYHLPAGQLTWAGRIGPVEVGCFIQFPAGGLGLQAGFAIGD
jgi:hypothetical protein